MILIKTVMKILTRRKRFRLREKEEGPERNLMKKI